MLFYIFFCILLAVAVFCVYAIARADFRRRIIPDAYLCPLLLLGLIIVNFFPWICSPTESVIGATFGYLLASGIGWLFEKIGNTHSDIAPIGMGDIKLLAVGGIWLGVTGLSIAMAIACVCGMIWGRIKKQKYIPFAPFFFVGAFLALIALRFLL